MIKPKTVFDSTHKAEQHLLPSVQFHWELCDKILVEWGLNEQVPKVEKESNCITQIQKQILQLPKFKSPP